MILKQSQTSHNLDSMLEVTMNLIVFDELPKPIHSHHNSKKGIIPRRSEEEKVALYLQRAMVSPIDGGHGRHHGIRKRLDPGFVCI